MLSFVSLFSLPLLISSLVFSCHLRFSLFIFAFLFHSPFLPHRINLLQSFLFLYPFLIILIERVFFLDPILSHSHSLCSPLSLIISIYPLLDFLTLSLSLDSSLTDLHVLSPILNHRRFRSLNFPLSQFPSLSFRDSSSSNSPSVLSPSRFSLLRFGLLSFSLFVSNFITFAFPHDLSFLILLL